MLFDYFLIFLVGEFVFASLRILIELTILHIINVHYRLQQKWLVNSPPMVSSSGGSPSDNSSHFYSCCPMRGYIWTAFLNPIDRPPTSSTFFRTTLLSPSFHPKPLHYSFHPPLTLIFMLLLISGDIRPNPGPIDPCSVCSHRVTWRNRSVQCTNCSLWVHLSCSGLSPTDFRKISPGHSWTCPMCPSSIGL